MAKLVRIWRTATAQIEDLRRGTLSGIDGERRQADEPAGQRDGTDCHGKIEDFDAAPRNTDKRWGPIPPSAFSMPFSSKG